MKPDVVVDVGNTRIKWGRCESGRVAAVVSLPPDAPEVWTTQLAAWNLAGPHAWAVSGVHPARCAALIAWLRGQHQTVWKLDHASQLPLSVNVAEPDKVGIDRLLNAVAIRCRAQPADRNRPAIIIDAGSAVTVDLVDEANAFRGGAILPGLRLMANALHDYTALLPLVDLPQAHPNPVGRSTVEAITSGIYYAVAGGINTLVQRYRAEFGSGAPVFLTGGDGPRLQSAVLADARLWPEMTLEGIRLAAEAQP